MAGAVPLHIVLTVPAIWPEYARKKMLQGAQNAGICDDTIAGKTQVALVAEPEAAAIATLSSSLQELNKIRTGDCIVVLDVGG